MNMNPTTEKEMEENIEFLEFLLNDLKSRNMDPMDINFVENELYKSKLELHNLKTTGKKSIGQSFGGKNMGHMTTEQEELLREFEKMLGYDEPPPIPKECSCGAKHTSNPKWHMQYCDLHE